MLNSSWGAGSNIHCTVFNLTVWRPEPQTTAFRVRSAHRGAKGLSKAPEGRPVCSTRRLVCSLLWTHSVFVTHATCEEGDRTDRTEKHIQEARGRLSPSALSTKMSRRNLRAHLKPRELDGNQRGEIWKGPQHRRSDFWSNAELPIMVANSYRKNQSGT